MGNIKPHYNNKFPRRKYKSYFSTKSDEYFMKEHPMAYKFLCIIGIFALLLPDVILLIVSSLVFHKNINDSGWAILGFIGSFICGIGLFNIVAAFIDQYLGHKVTVICIVLGIAIMALSVFLV